MMNESLPGFFLKVPGNLYWKPMSHIEVLTVTTIILACRRKYLLRFDKLQNKLKDNRQFLFIFAVVIHMEF